MARSGAARRQQVSDAVARLQDQWGDGLPVASDPHGLATLVVRLLDAGESCRPADVALAVRALCEHFGALRGGRTVELRVPPYAAVQLAADGDAGPSHTRGTPPNVVETDAATFLRLAVGSLDWDDAVARHLVRTSGVHADLGTMFLLFRRSRDSRDGRSS